MRISDWSSDVCSSDLGTVMRRIKGIARFNRCDELHWNNMRALVQKLEHSVLRIGADPAPGYRSSGAIHWLSIFGDALAVALILWRRELGWRKPEPPTLSKNGAGWDLHKTGIMLVGRIGRAHVGTTAQ